jgi:predicted transcriptional regulator
MATQHEIVVYLKVVDRWVTMEDLVNQFKVDKPNLNKKVQQLHRYKLISIILDGKKHLIRINKNGGI